MYESRSFELKRATEKQYLQIRESNVSKLAQVKAEYERILAENADAPGITYTKCTINC